MRRLLYLLILLTGHFSASFASVQTDLERAQAAFDQRYADLEVPLLHLRRGYENFLHKLETQAQKQAELEWVLAVQAEREALERDASTDPGNFVQLARAQKRYLDQRTELQQQLERRRDALLQSYQRNLRRLQHQLTRADEIEQALAVREALARVKERIDQRLQERRASAPPQPAEPLFSTSFEDRSMSPLLFWSAGYARKEEGRIVLRPTSQLLMREGFSGNLKFSLHLTCGAFAEHSRLLDPDATMRISFGDSAHAAFRFGKRGLLELSLNGQVVTARSDQAEGSYEGVLTLCCAGDHWRLDFREKDGVHLETAWHNMEVPQRGSFRVELDAEAAAALNIDSLSIAGLPHSELPPEAPPVVARRHPLPERPAYLREYPMIDGLFGAVQRKLVIKGDPMTPVIRGSIPGWAEWRTEVVREQHAEARCITFVWSGVLREAPGEYDISVNGTRVMNLPAPTETRTWSFRQTRLFVEMVMPGHALFFLTVPMRHLKVDDRQQIRAVGRRDGAIEVMDASAYVQALQDAWGTED